MKIKVEWEEFVAKAMQQIRREHPSAGEPEFMKDYGPYESVGNMYDLPTFVEIELTGENRNE